MRHTTLGGAVRWTWPQLPEPRRASEFALPSFFFNFMLMSRRRVRVRGGKLTPRRTYPFHFRHTLVFSAFFMQMSFFVYLAGIVFAAIRFLLSFRFVFFFAAARIVRDLIAARCKLICINCLAFFFWQALCKFKCIIRKSCSDSAVNYWSEFGTIHAAAESAWVCVEHGHRGSNLSDMLAIMSLVANKLKVSVAAVFGKEKTCFQIL